MSEPAWQTAAEQESSNSNLPGYQGSTGGFFDLEDFEGAFGLMGSQLNLDS